MEQEAKFQIFTLGCKVNQYESEQIREILLTAGFMQTDLEPEWCIVNTCAVVIYSPDGKHETSKAFVVPRKPKSPSPQLRDKLMGRIKETLLSYQLPSDIVFLEELPVMKSGKINYPLLEKMCN